MVAIDSRLRRDGREIEKLGWYDPIKSDLSLEFDEDRLVHWLDKGAIPSDTLKTLLKKKGFNYMDSPGYDPVSITGQIASGANIVCFTTGRGSVFGCKPTPSLKLATNTNMYLKMEEDMDFNCGDVLDSGISIQEMGEQIFRLILDTASGKPSKSEAQGFGDNEFLPWQVGAVM